jgi:hypothetical protein
MAKLKVIFAILRTPLKIESKLEIITLKCTIRYDNILIVINMSRGISVLIVV